MDSIFLKNMELMVVLY
ncbi:hypothetical protein BpHYR1_012128 [Brachionus plicatilis]|uniref:Uncharacterized protein n=1 Tax=Brachionus plicatilis TaxID=10195 RepID=A0A3M7SZM7_BRAPC|nr:hypothetical protein BpHYR1_012128 [Brachionus plicatilis]